MAPTSTTPPPAIDRRPFGTMPDGTPVEAITLAGGGTSVTVITLGASVQAVRVPDRRGRIADVVLGYDDLRGYVDQPSYFGATVGRFANRIAGGRYVLDGRTCHAARNDGVHSLHGGVEGFDKRVWTVGSIAADRCASVTLTLLSPDGDQGHPGNLAVAVTFAVDGDGTLSQVIRAVTDAPTIVGLTNHSFWNLSGSGTAMGHRLTVPAATFTPVDETLVPTGEFRPVAGTPFDFTAPAIVGDRLRDGRDAQLVLARGFDHNWVIDRAAAPAPRPVARLEDPASGRVLELLSTEPGLQVYSANFLDGTIVGKERRIYRRGDAICLEPQRFPDTPNRPAFGSARLAPGERYENHMIFRFSTVEAAERAEG